MDRKSTLLRILNGIMILAVLFLMGITSLWLQGRKTEEAYAQLAKVRQAQGQQHPQSPVPDGPDASFAAEPGQNIQGGSPGSGLTLSPNPNASWLAINPDYAGWVQVPGTAMDYPFVRGRDNEEYLTRDFYGKPARAGSIFMDYRNLGGRGEIHTMLYGHNMKNGSMFHDLVKYHDADFLQENPTIILSDLYTTKTYRIFSVYEVSADDYSLPVAFASQAAYLNFLNDLAQRSLHPLSLNLDGTEQLLSLITCSYGVNNGRTIIHALAQQP